MNIIAVFLVLGAAVMAGMAWGTDGVAGAVLIGTACFLGIFARMAQAEYHRERMREELNILRTTIKPPTPPKQPGALPH